MPKPLSKAAIQRRKDVNNAKRRYVRQADRYSLEASKLPENSREREILTRAASQLRERSSELNGINIRKRFTKDQSALINDSKNYLVKNNRSEWARGETLGKLRLNGTNLGHRFFALTESLWAGTPYTGPGDDRRLNAIRRALNGNSEITGRYGSPVNTNDMIEIIGNLYGGDLEDAYTIGDSKEIAMMCGVRDVIKRYG